MRERPEVGAQALGGRARGGHGASTYRRTSAQEPTAGKERCEQCSGEATCSPLPGHTGAARLVSPGLWMAAGRRQLWAAGSGPGLVGSGLSVRGVWHLLQGTCGPTALTPLTPLTVVSCSQGRFARGPLQSGWQEQCVLGAGPPWLFRWETAETLRVPSPPCTASQVTLEGAPPRGMSISGGWHLERSPGEFRAQLFRQVASSPGKGGARGKGSPVWIT